VLVVHQQLELGRDQVQQASARMQLNYLFIQYRFLALRLRKRTEGAAFGSTDWFRVSIFGGSTRN
jgi:hypothetical protein